MHKGRILLVKRGSEPGKNKWSVPGGLIELGETVTETAVREVKEETGLDVEVQRLVDVVDNIETDDGGRVRYHFVTIDVLASPKKGNLKAKSDVVDARWVRIAEAEKYDLTKTLRGFLQRNRDTLLRFDLTERPPLPLEIG